MENVMVPKEPTSEILIAMADAIGCTDMLHDRATESPLDAAAAAYKAILPFAQAAPAVEQGPVGAGELDFVGAQFGLKFTDGCDNGCAEIYSEDDDNWFLQIRCDRIWLGDLADILQKAGAVGRLANTFTPAPLVAHRKSESRIAELELDAGRYRLLRYALCNPITAKVDHLIAQEILLDADEMDQEQFDAAIDAQLATDKGEG